MSKFCEEARHLVIQLFGHFVENKSQFLTANHAANLAFIVKCHFLSKSHVLAKTKQVLSGIEKASPWFHACNFLSSGRCTKNPAVFLVCCDEIQCICVYTRSAWMPPLSTAYSCLILQLTSTSFYFAVFGTSFLIKYFTVCKKRVRYYF